MQNTYFEYVEFISTMITDDLVSLFYGAISDLYQHDYSFVVFVPTVYQVAFEDSIFQFFIFGTIYLFDDTFQQLLDILSCFGTYSYNFTAIDSKSIFYFHFDLFYICTRHVYFVDDWNYFEIW